MLMTARPATAAHKRYTIRTLAFMSGYVAVMVALIFGAFDEIQGKPAAWVLAAVVTAPIVGQIWATLSLMRETDEFFRAVMAKQFIVASGLAMALFTGWGFAESFAGAPHAPGWYIYPLFWGLVGLTAPFIRSSQG